MANDTVILSGRIDSENASQMENDLMTQIGNDPNLEHIVIDASGLMYISSAGLRVLMKLKKIYKADITVKDVSPDIYDIFETTGFTELLNVKKKIREISLDNCEVIGKGFYGTVYRMNEDTIVKMYNSAGAVPMIENEKKMAKMAFLKGIPTAISFDIVKCNDQYGSVFELLKSKTFNDLIIEKPQDADTIVHQYVDFLKTVHKTLMDAGTLPSAKDIFLDHLGIVSEYLDQNTIDKCRKLLSELPDDLHVVHGDFQMKNVMLADDEPMLIDMDTLSTGQPIFDLQGLYVTYQIFGEDEPDNSMNFLGISKEMTDFIWEKIIEYYYEDLSEDELAAVTDRIKLLAYIRFLHILAVSDLKNGELGEIRIKHSSEHLQKLAVSVDSLF